jgi:sarcosine oxidase subunit alpha
VSTQPYRIDGRGQVDTNRPLTFTFDGVQYTGYAGDTLASALLANGVRLMGRSFKYHRPRGVVTSGANEPNALVTLNSGARTTPNLRATMVELYDGLEAHSQNRWPSLRFDVRAVNNWLKPFLPAGFYYKTFMWPARFWEKVYEPTIRKSAGLGTPTLEPDPDRYERANAHCDVVIAGGGPSGLMAALTAGRAGLRVILCDENHQLGGQLLGDGTRIDGNGAGQWVAGVLRELADMDNVRVMARTTLFGAYDHNTFGAIEQVNEDVPEPRENQPRERLWHIEAERLVIGAGAHERPIAFSGNDKPGVMLASAARCYVNRFGVRPGVRAVVFGNNADIHATADDLANAGVEVVGVVDGRSSPGAGANGHTVISGRVTRVHGAGGVTGVELDNGEYLRCDLVCVAGGWNPVVHLSSQQGVLPVWDDAIQSFVPGKPKNGEVAVGAASGRFTTQAALEDGAEAGRQAAKDLGYQTPKAPKVPKVEEPAQSPPEPLWAVPGHDKTAFIDPQNDVTVADVKLAVREGYHNVEHMKRYTTLGMATDQGKIANVVGLGVLAEHRGVPMAEIGTTTFRPPYTPISIGPLAGYNRQETFLPVRYTPLHHWQAEKGASFVEAGAWKRARFFPRDGENMGKAADREVRNVRSNVGMVDVSTLGRIDVQGPDAAEFLNRVYINGWKRLAVGKARYGVMLREDGLVLDDGTTSRLGEQHYLMTSTTGQAAKVLTHLEFCLQALWPELDVNVCSVTDQWAGIAIAGPNSRALLQRLFPKDDLSSEAFPFMGAGTFDLDGIEARLFRISFSGELGYELNVPADYGPAVAERLLELGGDLGVDLYGLEALDIMRIEKGHVTGNELDGRVSAQDLGMGGMLSGKKDYIGRRLSQMPAYLEEDRPRLVGLKPTDPSKKANAGAHLLPQGADETPANDLGWVSSATWSPTLESYIALGFIAGGPNRKGEVVRAVDFVRNSDVTVEVVDSVFVDPEGARQRA